MRDLILPGGTGDKTGKEEDEGLFALLDSEEGERTGSCVATFSGK